MRVTLSGTGPANTGAQGSEARSLGLTHAEQHTSCQQQANEKLSAEAPLEVLPRLFHIKYDSGLKEELLFMSDPQETETPSGADCAPLPPHMYACFQFWELSKAGGSGVQADTY